MLILLLGSKVGSLKAELNSTNEDSRERSEIFEELIEHLKSTEVADFQHMLDEEV